MTSKSRTSGRREDGFALAEALAVLVVLAIVVLISGQNMLRLIHRYQTTSAVREVYSIVLATRMLAIRSTQNAVVQFDIAGNSVHAWVDGNGNFVQDSNEPTRLIFMVPPITRFSFPRGGNQWDVAFDGYNGNRTLTDRIVFRPDGTIVSPECTKCNSPRQIARTSSHNSYPDVPFGSIDCRGTNIPSTGLPPLHGTWNGNNGFGCRGVYMTRVIGTSTLSDDVFRISMDDFRRSVSILKWVGPNTRAGVLFVPPDPAWIWFD
jgi:type II secretory pathway pseudopilin PulG